MEKKNQKIAITGPESSGKTSLVSELATFYQSVFVPEYSREYLSIRTDYTFDDVLEIAKGQLKREDELIGKANRFLFCDTDMMLHKIWCDVKFGKCHEWINRRVDEDHYDLYLLCKPDIEWEYDPLRENKTDRNRLFERYNQEFSKRNFNYKIVQGQGKERLQNAIEIISNFTIEQS